MIRLTDCELRRRSLNVGVATPYRALALIA
jgi:hypothetical protein